MSQKAELLTREQVASCLSVSISMVDKLKASGKLPVVRLSKRLPRFRRADVEQFIQDRLDSASPEHRRSAFFTDKEAATKLLDLIRNVGNIGETVRKAAAQGKRQRRGK